MVARTFDHRIEPPRINNDVLALKAERKAIQTAWRRPIEIFAINGIVRSMTGALKALTIIAEWYLTSHMDAFLIQRRPVGAISILNPGFTREQLDERCPTDQPGGLC